MKTDKLPDSKASQDPTAFTAWGTMVGAALGVGIGLLTRHWIAWAFGCAVLGWIVGGVLDRSRRS